jgi:phage gp29-like protein
MADNKPLLGEFAKDDHGMFMAQAHIATLLANPDSVLRSRGSDLKIYDELLRDDQVKSTFGQRIDSVVSKETEVIPGGKRAIDKAAADFIKEQLDNLGRWDEIYRKMSFGLFYGWAAGECMWRIGSRYVELADIRVRDRSRFGFNADNRLVHFSARNPQGQVMPEQKFWQFNSGASHDDNPHGLGLAHSVYWPVFFKRNGIKFWLIFLEKFGMPTSVAKLSPAKIDDPAERRKALAVLRSIQSDAGVVVPEDMTVELLEAARSGTADYDALCQRMDQAISKVMVGQTMTTDSGSSMAQAMVHKEVADEIEKADADLICGSFNAGPVRWLIDWNFPGAAYPRVWRKIEPPEDLQALVERDTKIFSLGYEPTEEYIEETYGPGWVKRETTAFPSAGQFGWGSPEFSEVNELARKRIDNRADQDQLITAAAALATKYDEVYGSRIEQLVNYLEESQDFATFQKHLTEMIAEGPAPEAVDKIRNATFTARLMALLRGQR